MDYTLKSIKVTSSHRCPKKEKVIRSVKALLLSLFLHLLIILLFVLSFEKIFVMPPQKSEKSITLNLKEFVPTPPPAPPVVEPVVEEVIEPPVPEEVQEVVEQEIPQEKLQEMTKQLFQKIANMQAKENNATKIADEVIEPVVKKEVKEPKKESKKEPLKEVKKEAPKKKEKAKKIVKKKKKLKKPKKIVKKKTVKKKRKPKKVVKRRMKKRSKDPLANALMSGSSSVRRPKRPGMKMIKQFYGSEFNSFTPTQKKFIEKNLGSIYRITQRTLTRNGYPRVAARTQQQGTQIVTFYLHPNGAISGLRYKRRLGYGSLDANTLKVIRIAYKDYPRPKTKTKITFYVEYSLY